VRKQTDHFRHGVIGGHARGGQWKAVWISRHTQSDRAFSACCGGAHAKEEIGRIFGSVDVRNQTDHSRHGMGDGKAKGGTGRLSGYLSVCAIRQTILGMVWGVDRRRREIGRLFGSHGVRNQTEHFRHAGVGGHAKGDVEG